MGWAGPYSKLSPRPPPSSLVSKSVIISLIGHIAIFAAVQLFLIYLVTDMSWFVLCIGLVDERYIPPIVDPDNPEIRNSDNTVLFLISCYQYIMIAIILSVGPPYREPMIQNGILKLDSSNDSSVYGDHRYSTVIHDHHNLAPTAFPGINVGIDLYQCIVCIPSNSYCIGKFHRELDFREDHIHSSSRRFG